MRASFALAIVVLGLVGTEAVAGDKSRPTSPQGNQASWFPQNVYPAEAKRAGQQGRVSVELDVSDTGKPTACRVISSSGYTLLDVRTCELAMQNGRFNPARDAKGHAVAAVYTMRGVVWKLDDDSAGSAKPGVEGFISALAGQPSADVSAKPFNKTRTVSVDIDDQGRAQSCRTSGPYEGEDPCASFQPGKVVFPRLTRDGKPVAGTITVTMDITATPK